MGAGDASAQPAVSLAEAQAYARVESGEEEALLVGLVRSASALCEAFIGQLLIQREQVVELRASADWQRLGAVPVRAITAVEALGDGMLEVGDYETDIDARGEGWVRLTNAGSTQAVRVTLEAGMASDPNGLPEPLRQGVLRLVAHLYASRDASGSGSGGEPPAAITALWRPYRRMRLS